MIKKLTLVLALLAFSSPAYATSGDATHQVKERLCKKLNYAIYIYSITWPQSWESSSKAKSSQYTNDMFDHSTDQLYKFTSIYKNWCKE